MKVNGNEGIVSDYFEWDNRYRNINVIYFISFLDINFELLYISVWFGIRKEIGIFFMKWDFLREGR